MRKLLLAGVAALVVTVGVGVYLNPPWLARIREGRAAPTEAPPAGVAPASPNTSNSPSAGATQPADGAPPPTPTPEAALPLPFTESTTDVAAEELGGHVDQATGSYGSGYFGKRLIDTSTELPWTATDRIFPQEALFSFYNRQPALISAVVIVLPDEAAYAPKDVEVWTSAQDEADTFAKVAAQTLAPQPAEQKITFGAVEARYVKLQDSLNGLERPRGSPRGPDP